MVVVTQIIFWSFTGALCINNDQLCFYKHLGVDFQVCHMNIQLTLDLSLVALCKKSWYLNTFT